MDTTTPNMISREAVRATIQAEARRVTEARGLIVPQAYAADLHDLPQCEALGRIETGLTFVEDFAEHLLHVL